MRARLLALLSLALPAIRCAVCRRRCTGMALNPAARRHADRRVGTLSCAAAWLAARAVPQRHCCWDM